MRFISIYKGFTGPTLRAEKERIYGNGEREVLQKGYSAAPFVNGSVTDYEREVVLKEFHGKIRGLAEGEDPLWRLSSYDTDHAAEEHGWTPEEKAQFEAILIDRAGSDYILVESPLRPAPWPSYDKQTTVIGKRTLEHVVAKVVETVSDLELDPADVIAYERDNLNRSEIIDALTAPVDETPGDTVITA